MQTPVEDEKKEPKIRFKWRERVGIEPTQAAPNFPYRF